MSRQQKGGWEVLSLWSFGLGVVSASIVTYLVVKEEQKKSLWIPTAYEGHKIPNKAELLAKFQAKFSEVEYQVVKDSWKKLALAKYQKDMNSLCEVLTDDCIYDLYSTGRIWRGHAGAVEYYSKFFSAFPDVEIETTEIIIGTEGVCQEVLVSGTHSGKWLHFKPSG
eukprot:CAMPEP_0174264964 /NCGR_PEP_ID=MMETSP0439-20130205/24630_1 /TAXON_ID=0 /ORGANISM="Stereomyxa ramosa, Strain Chinc5" /LENGTH=166 /DNA_ID=CAMNT_0015351145 /DNA_START=32 /DNA_END=528 /DNA_ORIENTATION=-